MKSLTNAVRLDPRLVAAAQLVAIHQKRTVPKQIEYWAELGRAVGAKLRDRDITAILDGFNKIEVEVLSRDRIDPNDVFNSLENDRKSGELAKKLTSAKVYYEASREPGLIDRIDSVTGKRQTGHFHNGEFKVVQG